MSQVTEFGPYRLDPVNALLEHGQRRLELAPKAFAVLCHLAERPGRLVTKDELLDAVWGRRFVSESVLKTAINAIRAALDDDPRAPTYIETVARRGYRFIGHGKAAGAASDRPAAPTAAPALPPAEPGPAPPPPDAAPAEALVGRGPALEALVRRLDEARAGRRQIVLVAGEAGVGKSTLLRRFADEASRRGGWLAIGQCIEQHGGSEPYLPVLDALAMWCRGGGAAAWQAGLERAAPAWLAQLPWLPQPAGGAARDGGASPQDRMLREFGALLDTLPADALPVLVLEDLHWSDNASVNLLGYLARRVGGGRWMLVASYRPTEVAAGEHPLAALRHELKLHRLVAELALDAFSEQEVDEFLRRQLPGGTLARHAELARALHRHTDGLPLFVASALEEMVAGGALRQAEDGRWATDVDALARLPLPETVSGIIEKQIGALPAELRGLLEAASVAGVEFVHAIVADVLGEEADRLQSRLDELARRGTFLRSAGMAALPDGRLAVRYAFRHALVQRVFYQRMEPSRRLQLHRRTAAALQRAHGAEAHRLAAELALHHERVRDIAAAAGARLADAEQEALRWRLAAARAAAALQAPADALAHYAQALAAGPTEAERARILAERALPKVLRGDGPGAVQDSAEALALARRLGDPALLADVLLQRASVCARCDLPGQAVERIDELLAMTAAADGASAALTPLARAARVEALATKGEALRSLGELAAADAAWAAALAEVPDDRPGMKARILGAMVVAHFQRATYAEGLALARRGLALCEQAADRHGAAMMLNRVGVLATMVGDADAAEEALLAARDRSRELGDIDGQRRALANLVKLETDRGRPARALELLHEAWSLADSFESPQARCALLQGFFYCEYQLGHLGRALAEAERALASTEGLAEAFWRVGMPVLVSDLYIHLGDTARARAMIDAALALSVEQDVEHQRLKAVARRAWLDVLAGDATAGLARLDALGESGLAAENPEDRNALARVRAQAQLALGDAAGALATLASAEGTPTIDTRALMLALRLDAGCRLGAPEPAAIDAAVDALATGRLPAIECLVLRRSLAAAWAAAGRAGEAAAEAAAARALRDRLAASLDALPERRRAFLAQFAD